MIVNVNFDIDLCVLDCFKVCVYNLEVYYIDKCCCVCLNFIFENYRFVVF